MISLLAVSMALAFWTPINGGAPICNNDPAQVQVSYYHEVPVDVVARGVAPGSAGYADVGGGCVIALRDDVPTWPVDEQCDVVAHELGHGALGLQHVDDPANVMFAGDGGVVPAACVPPEPRAVRPRVAPRPDASPRPSVKRRPCSARKHRHARCLRHPRS